MSVSVGRVCLSVCLFVCASVCLSVRLVVCAPTGGALSYGDARRRVGHACRSSVVCPVSLCLVPLSRRVLCAVVFVSCLLACIWNRKETE